MIIRNNLDIRIEMLKAEISVTQLAKQLKITRPYLSKKLRYTISQEEKEKLLKAIEEIKKENNK